LTLEAIRPDLGVCGGSPLTRLRWVDIASGGLAQTTDGASANDYAGNFTGGRWIPGEAPQYTPQYTPEELTADAASGRWGVTRA
jgi:hypothetical protein